MKKLIAVALVILTVFAVVFAQGTKESATSKPVLKVATSPDFAPYEFYAISSDGTPTLAGFDIALAKYIADYLGYDVEYIPMDFDGIILEVQTGNADIGIAGFSPSEDRKEVVDFSVPYYEGGQSFVCLQKNASKYTSLDDLNVASLKVGAQTGSIQVGLAETYSANTDIIQLTKVTDIIAEVLAGTLDGAYIETAVANSYKENYPQLFIAVDVPYDALGSCAMLKKGSSLTAKVNEAISAALKDGSMDKFVADANELASGNIYEGLLENK